MGMSAREMAWDVWQAGVDRVKAERLVAERVRLQGTCLELCSSKIDLDHVQRIGVVGAGKAAGHLALALVNLLRPLALEKRLHGWVNVPANCVIEDEFVHLHAARPAGVNEPRAEGVAGTREIMRCVRELGPDDLAICVLTGGGSALLPAPCAGVTLDDKLLVTRLLSSRGATIQEINAVRIALSVVKGGGLAAGCGADHLVTLIVSDIIGDPVNLIASGPTVTGERPAVPPASTLRKYVQQREVGVGVWRALEVWKPSERDSSNSEDVHLLGNNTLAVEAAVAQAERLGLSTQIVAPERSGTTAEEVGYDLLQRIAAEPGPECIVWGGEPIVRLHDRPGKGGRNQQLVLAALSRWSDVEESKRERLCLLSGGTDGEDGPTDAAGAMVDAEIARSVYNQGLDIADCLRRNDAYTVFEKSGGLIKTGPTHTNVCDLRVAVIGSS